MREKRRSLSLKGRESFEMSREVEEKLVELEKKMMQLESGQLSSPNKTSQSAGKSRMRRNSLDSVTAQPISLLLRLSSLESKINLSNEPKKVKVTMSFHSLVADEN